MGGLWAAAPRIALGVPPVSRGAPAHPASPSTSAWSGVAAGSAGSTEGVKVAATAGLVGEHPKCVGGQMLL